MAGCSFEQGGSLGLDCGAIKLNHQLRRRALHPFKVLLERKRNTVVDANHFEDAVATQETNVVGRHERVFGFDDLTVQGGKHRADSAIPLGKDLCPRQESNLEPSD